MTTSVLKTKSKFWASGISLLEVVIALLVMSLLMTIGLVIYNGQADDKALNEAVTKFEMLSSRARALSFLKQEPYRISFEEAGEVVLLKSKSLSPQSDWSKEEERNSGFTEVERIKTNLSVSLRRWGAKDDAWQFYSKEKPLDWRFSPAGLCEPVSIRFKDGENWILLHMHPLTGRVEEMESYIN